MLNKNIKQISKQHLQNRRLKAFFIIFFSLIMLLFFSSLPYFSILLLRITNIKTLIGNKTVYTVILSAVMLVLSFWALSAYSSLSLGEKAWYSGKMSRNQLCGKKLLFWFKPKSSLKALRFSFVLFFIKAMWSFTLLLPSILIFSSIIILAYSGGIELYLFCTLSGGGLFLLILGLIFRFIVVQRYFAAPYLIASSPKTGSVEAIKLSKELTSGHIGEIIKFKLSFMPLALSCIFIVPIIFFLPYYKQSCSVIAKSLSL